MRFWSVFSLFTTGEEEVKGESGLVGTYQPAKAHPQEHINTAKV